jgi:hypothetical protein
MSEVPLYLAFCAHVSACTEPEPSAGMLCDAGLSLTHEPPTPHPRLQQAHPQGPNVVSGAETGSYPLRGQGVIFDPHQVLGS